ncbi:MAG: aminotransferase class I/II-fold pyridoxal phosphate-dependent enzyme, partial [Bacteroidetes bacterium]|nr:aminotransferase class I/II-fold pyridoxal phosphate-dependent enzyme [Bacteroidota bacterium]
MEINKRLSSRVDRLSESKTLRMSRLSRELKEKGIDVISLSLGEPDFDTPAYIQNAAKQAIDDGYTYYPPVGGYMDLRKAICDKYEQLYGWKTSTENVVVSNGAKQSLANLILSIVDFDDDVLIPAPYWVTYPEQVNLAGGKYRTVNASVDQDYKITAEQLDNALTQQTRMFIFSSPSNPTGSVYSDQELHDLAMVFEKFPNLVIVSDEIYEHINFIGKPNSLAKYESLRQRLVVVNGVSKGFAMT